ncbi:MAG: hypothetical protein ACO3UU_10405 [Minisyncoccia bacterium]
MAGYIDRYSVMQNIYDKVAITGYKKFVNLNDRYTYMKPTTKALVEWKIKYPNLDNNERVNPKRTNQNSSKRIIV